MVDCGQVRPAMVRPPDLWHHPLYVRCFYRQKVQFQEVHTEDVGGFYANSLLGPGVEHFHFYSAHSSSAKCGFSWGKATSGAMALYAPEVKMLAGFPISMPPRGGIGPVCYFQRWFLTVHLPPSPCREMR